MLEGYVDDCRNTDNAWVETTVLNIHLDRTHQVMADINSTVRKWFYYTNIILRLHKELKNWTESFQVTIPPKENIKFPISVMQSSPCWQVSSHVFLRWIEVSSKTRLSSDQRDSLQRVAELHNRKFWFSHIAVNMPPHTCLMGPYVNADIDWFCCTECTCAKRLKTRHL